MNLFMPKGGGVAAGGGGQVGFITVEREWIDVCVSNLSVLVHVEIRIRV